MADLFQPEQKQHVVNKLLIVGIVTALAAIGLGIFMLSRKPSMPDQTAIILDDSYREGSPEFTEITGDIIIGTDNNTVESPTGMGTISMYIKGNVKNKGTRTITALEVNVGVVTQKNEVLREKRVLVVPAQQSVLGPGETIPITLTLDGFNRKDDRADIRWKVTAIRSAN